MTDFRALCAELAGWIERSTRHYIQDPDVLIRAYAALDEPEPAPPAAGEVGELVDALRCEAVAAEGDHLWMSPSELHRAADLLEQRHPVPVPVAERLPGPEDCDEMGQCWWFDAELWCLDIYDHEYTHWLPAHALPLPSGEVEHD